MIFLAARSDGFGERLRALLNTVVLSRHLGSEMRVYWPPIWSSIADHHSILSPEETFSETFRLKHIVDRRTFRSMKTVTLAQYEADLSEGDGTRGNAAIIVERHKLRHQAPRLCKGIDASSAFRTAFDSIEFSDDLEVARGRANALCLPTDAVALHLRAGDIVYGRYRAFPRYHTKVCSAPIAIAVIGALIESGRTPLVFGQDQELCRTLRDEFGATISSDLSDCEGFSEAQRAMFDISLMSRCSDILGSNSGFVLAAAMISGTEVREPATLLSSAHTLDMLARFLPPSPMARGIPPLQLALSFWHAFEATEALLPRDPLMWRFLEAAQELDPENPFYAFVRCCDLFARGNHAAAEDGLLRLLSAAKGDPPTILDLLTFVMPGKAVTAMPYFPILREAVEDRSALAALCLALSERALGNHDTAKDHGALYLRYRPDSLASLDDLLPGD